MHQITFTLEEEMKFVLFREEERLRVNELRGILFWGVYRMIKKKSSQKNRQNRQKKTNRP